MGQRGQVWPSGYRSQSSFPLKGRAKRAVAWERKGISSPHGRLEPCRGASNARTGRPCLILRAMGNRPGVYSKPMLELQKSWGAGSQSLAPHGVPERRQPQHTHRIRHSRLGAPPPSKLWTHPHFTHCQWLSFPAPDATLHLAVPSPDSPRFATAQGPQCELALRFPVAAGCLHLGGTLQKVTSGLQGWHASAAPPWRPGLVTGFSWFLLRLQVAKHLGGDGADPVSPETPAVFPRVVLSSAPVPGASQASVQRHCGLGFWSPARLADFSY